MSLPSQVRTNQDLEKMVDTTDEWIQSRTGIRERRIAGDDESTLSLALGASKQAIATAGLAPEDIEMIIVATITPDYGFPAVANLLQDALAARNAAALDINSACTGFLAGLALADGMIVSGHINNVLQKNNSHPNYTSLSAILTHREMATSHPCYEYYTQAYGFP